MTRATAIGTALVALVATGAAAMVLSETFDLSWHEIAGGGQTFATGDVYEMGSTIGQPEATSTRALTGDIYSLTGGFWVVGTTKFCAGDGDGDGVVGFDDLLIVLTGWGPCPEPGLKCPGDFDLDGFVEFDDLLTVLNNWDCGQPLPNLFDESLLLTGLSPDDWDAFMRVLEEGSESEGDIWRCWIKRSLQAAMPGWEDVPLEDCPEQNPFSS